MRRGFERAIKSSGVRRVRFHDLRHTCAALLIEGGTDIKTIQAIMGHSSISVTLNHYGHLYSSSYQRAVQALDGVMKNPEKLIRIPLASLINDRETGII